MALCALGAAWLCWLQVAAAEPPTIQRLEPTPLFPRAAANQPLRQHALLCLDNPGAPRAVTARITLGSAGHTEDLGHVPTGKSTNAVMIPDTAAPARLTVELVPKAGEELLAHHELM